LRAAPSTVAFAEPSAGNLDWSVDRRARANLPSHRINRAVRGYRLCHFDDLLRNRNTICKKAPLFNVNRGAGGVVITARKG
jgi:hypothetical protein